MDLAEINEKMERFGEKSGVFHYEDTSNKWTIWRSNHTWSSRFVAIVLQPRMNKLFEKNPEKLEKLMDAVQKEKLYIYYFREEAFKFKIYLEKKCVLYNSHYV